MSRTIRIVLMVSISLSGLGCSWCNRQEESSTISPPEIDARTTTTMPKKPWATIKADSLKISPGMTREEVELVLGAPDREWPLYEPQIYKPRRIGSSWVCVGELQGEFRQAFAVRFDLSGKVIKIDVFKNATDKWLGLE